MRCPNERTWHQGRGPSDPRRGAIHQCILDSGHPGPCAMEPTGRVSYVQPALGPEPVNAVRESVPRTPEQIAAADARYREHVRRRAQR